MVKPRVRSHAHEILISRLTIRPVDHFPQSLARQENLGALPDLL